MAGISPTTTDSQSGTKPSEQEEYRCVSVCCDDGREDIDGTTFHHGLDLLTLLASRPAIAEYVKEAQFYPDYADPQPESSFKYSAETIESLTTSYLQKLQLSNNDIAQWKVELLAGHDGAAFAIALMALPNVRKLELLGHGGQYKPYLDKVLQYAAAFPDDDVLSKVEEVSVQHWDTEFGEDDTVLHHIVLLPSLRVLRGFMIGCDVPLHYRCLRRQDTDEILLSKIEEVSLLQSQFCPHDLLEFIKPLVKLQHMVFECHQGSFLFCDCYEYCEGYNEEDCIDPGAYIDGSTEHLASFSSHFKKRVAPLLEERGMLWKIENDQDDSWDGVTIWSKQEADTSPDDLAEESVDAKTSGYAVKQTFRKRIRSQHKI